MCAGPFYRGPAYNVAILCMCKEVLFCSSAYSMAILCMCAAHDFQTLAYSAAILCMEDGEYYSYNESIKNTFINHIAESDVSAERLRRHRCRQYWRRLG